MTAHTLFQKLQRFKGMQIIDCEDDIKAIAEPLGYTVNVMDPTWNTPSIMTDFWRLNVMTDKDSIVTAFSTG